MKRRFGKKGIIIACAAIFIALVTLISIGTGGSGGVFTSFARGVTKPIRNISAAIVSQFESIYGYMYRYDAVVEENEQLKKEISELRENAIEYVEAVEENERFRELFELSSRHSDYKFDTATIVSWGSSNFTSTFTVSKGKNNSDVSAGDAVINESGALLGFITQVGATTSVATTVIDTKFSAGAVIESSGDAAVASGDFSLMRNGKLKLDFLTDDTRFYVGDSVVTSGNGGVYPKGLVIGYIDSVETNTGGEGSHAIITPIADFNNVIDVFIVTEFEVVE